MAFNTSISDRRRVLIALSSTVAVIFVAEMLVVLLLARLPAQSIWMGALLAAAALSILTFPAVYFFALRPIGTHGARHRLDERALAESESSLSEAAAKYQSIFENAPHGIYQSTPDGGFITANPCLARILGYDSVEELMNQAGDAASQLYACNTNRRAEFLTTLAQEPWTDGCEYEILRRDGVRRWLLEHARAVRDADGLLAYYEGTLADITDRVQAERALQESERSLKETQALAGLGTYVLDISTGRWTSSDVLDRILGIDAGFDRCLDASKSLVHPDWRDRVANYFMDEVIEAHRPFDVEYQIVRQNDGETRWVHGLGRLECDDQDRPIRVIGTVQDITDRKRTEERLREQGQLLRTQRLEGIGLLAGGIAHDLNNVLSPIVLAADLLKLEADADNHALLETISTHAQRGAEMVRGVLSFARGLEGRRVDIHVRHLVREIEGIARETFPKNIKVHVSTNRDLWSVAGDPTQLHQVLLNVCLNARDAMPEGGQISITARNVTMKANDANGAATPDRAEAGRYVVIQINDTGTGIPASIIDKIFDPFFTTKGVGKGTGLGLSTALTIVKDHGGFVRVSNAPGTGAQFQIYLPALPEVAAAHAAALQEMPRGDGELVLIVDDEAAVREITRQTLEAFGYRVLLASHGIEAVTLYRDHAGEIAIVVTDLLMPVMDGAATVRALMTLNPDVRIIAVSGSNDNVSATLPEIGAGVIPILSKPYTPATLLQALRRSMAGQDAKVPGPQVRRS